MVIPKRMFIFDLSINQITLNKMNYQKLMDYNPTSLGKFTNSLNQEIEFYEHPILGDEAGVVCVCHELKLASTSGFMETDDMVADHKEYEPLFIEGKLTYGMEGR